MVICFGYKFSPNMIGIQEGYNKNFHIKCTEYYEKFDSLLLFCDMKMVILESCYWCNCEFVTGYIFLLNSGAVSWCSSKQSVVAGSTCEAEYIAASEAANEGVHIRYIKV